MFFLERGGGGAMAPGYATDLQQLENRVIVVHKFMTPYFTKSRVIVLRVSKDCPNEAVFLLKKMTSSFINDKSHLIYHCHS